MSAALQIPGFCVRAEPWRCLDFCSFHCKIQVIGERWNRISAKSPEQERDQDVVGTTATETRLGAQRRDQKGGEVDRGWPVAASFIEHPYFGPVDFAKQHLSHLPQD